MSHAEAEDLVRSRKGGDAELLVAVCGDDEPRGDREVCHDGCRVVEEPPKLWLGALVCVFGGVGASEG